MIKHIVLWRLKDHAMGASKSENAGKLKALLETLRSTVKEIKHLEVGINTNVPGVSPHGADVALYSEFATWNDLEAYQKHPEHLKVVGFVQEIRLERYVVDYEIPDIVTS